MRVIPLSTISAFLSRRMTQRPSTRLTRLSRQLSRQAKLSSQTRMAKYLQISSCLCAMAMMNVVMTLHSKACILSMPIASASQALWTKTSILLWRKRSSTVVATAVHQSTSMPSMFHPKASQLD